jgi:hypothetical protein
VAELHQTMMHLCSPRRYHQQAGASGALPVRSPVSPSSAVGGHHGQWLLKVQAPRERERASRVRNKNTQKNKKNVRPNAGQDHTSVPECSVDKPFRELTEAASPKQKEEDERTEEGAPDEEEEARDGTSLFSRDLLRCEADSADAEADDRCGEAAAARLESAFDGDAEPCAVPTVEEEEHEGDTTAAVPGESALTRFEVLDEVRRAQSMGWSVGVGGCEQLCVRECGYSCAFYVASVREREHAREYEGG